MARSRLYQGAFVKLFNAGLFLLHIIHNDVKSMYPMIMAVFNLSPESVHIVSVGPYTGDYRFDYVNGIIEVPDENISLAVEHSSIDQVSKGFTLHAVNRSKTFSGGTGGGTEKWKQKFREQDKVLFIKYAGNMLQEIGYEI